MNLPIVERHSFFEEDNVDTKQRNLERINLVKNQFMLTDVPILCTPELLDENIEKIKLWFQNGGRINCYSEITPFKYGLSIVTLKDLEINKYNCEVVTKKGIINKEGTEIVPCSLFKNIVILNENLIRVQNNDNSYSLISTLTGKEIPNSKLYYIDTEYHDGLLVGLANAPQVFTECGASQINTYFYFDEYGNIVFTSSNYAIMGQFRNGLALVSKEKCISKSPRISSEYEFYDCPGFPINTYEYEYEYHKYLINKKGEIVENLGVDSVHSPDNLYARKTNNSIKEGIIFNADSYLELNKYLMDDLKFTEVKSSSSLSKGSTKDLRNLILSKYYNPKKEIEKAIEKVKYYTNNWEEIIEYIEYNDDMSIKTIHTKKVPYVYYINRDRLQLNIEYNPTYYLNRDNSQLDKNYNGGNRLVKRKLTKI